MFRGLRLHMRQNVVAYLALFVALGGTSYAAATIGPGDIRSDAVRHRHIEKGAVRAGDVRNGSLGTKDVRADSLKGRDIDESSLAGQAAVAFAHVNANTTLDQSRSENVVRVTQGSSGGAEEPGTYCFDLAPGVAAKNIVATRQAAANQVSPLEVVTGFPSQDPTAFDCPSGFQDAWVGFRGESDGVNTPFFVVFH